MKYFLAVLVLLSSFYSYADDLTPEQIAKNTLTWDRWLQNNRISRVSTTDSEGHKSSSTRGFDLCWNHRFSYYSHADSSFDSERRFGFTHTSNIEHGNWQIATGKKGETRLQLVFDNGRRALHTLEYRDDKIWLDNREYIRRRSKHCH